MYELKIPTQTYTPCMLNNTYSENPAKCLVCFQVSNSYLKGIVCNVYRFIRK